MISTWVKNREKCFKALEFAPKEKRKLRESDFENKDKVDFDGLHPKEGETFLLMVLLLRILTGKKHRQIKLQHHKKEKYGHMGRW